MLEAEAKKPEAKPKNTAEPEAKPKQTQPSQKTQNRTAAEPKSTSKQRKSEKLAQQIWWEFDEKYLMKAVSLDTVGKKLMKYLMLFFIKFSGPVFSDSEAIFSNSVRTFTFR